jgi:WD40 repeat protein
MHKGNVTLGFLIVCLGTSGAAFPQEPSTVNKTVISANNVARLSVVGRVTSGGAEIAAASFSPDGNLLATADYGGSVRVWQVATLEEPFAIKPPGNMVWGVRFSPDGSWLAYWGLDGIVLWDLRSQEIAHIIDTRGKTLTIAAFTPDGQSLVAGYTDGTVEVWDTARATRRDSWQLMAGSVLSFAYAPGGELLAVGGGHGDPRILILDWRTGVQRRALVGQENDVHDIVFLRDGNSLVTTGPRRIVLLWDLASGTPAPVSAAPGGNDFAAEGSPDGSLIVIAGAGSIQFRDADNMRVLHSLEHDGNGQIPIAMFSPDGTLLATSGSRHEVVLWAVVEAQEETGAGYVGTWEYDGPHVHFTFLLRPDGTGHLADEVHTFPFTYSLDAGSDPARLDLVYDVDMAFGRISHTLVRLERTDRGDLLHWVSRHSDSGPPEWPEASSRTPSGVTRITFHRVVS